jgi:hypothetical protein
MTSNIRSLPSPAVTRETAFDLTAHERAVEIAVRTLAVLAAQSALAAGALRAVGEALGSRTRYGIVAEGEGSFRAVIDATVQGTFATFDAALEELLRHVTR